MKKLILYFSLVAAISCSPFFSSAQNAPAFNIVPHYTNFGAGFEKGMSVQFDFPVGDKFTLNYSIGMGQHEKGGTYFHYTLGSLLSTKVPGFFVNNTSMSADDFKAMVGLMVLLALVPEGVTYYPLNNKRLKMGPYINLTGIDTYYDYEGFNYKQFVPEAGLRSGFLFAERSFLSFSAGVKFQTRFERPGLHLGLGLGFYFKDQFEPNE